MRVLVLNPTLPFPPVTDGDLRTYHLVQALARRHRVTLVGFKSGDDLACPPFAVRTIGVSWKTPKLWQEMEHEDPDVSSAAYHRLLNETDEPWFVSCMESQAMDRALTGVARDELDLVLIEHSSMARFLPILPPGVPIILDFLEVHSLRACREAEKASGPMPSPLLRERERAIRFERDAVARCVLCLAPNEAEADAARDLLGMTRLQVVPNGIDTSLFTPGRELEEPGSLLFPVGGRQAPDADVLRRLACEALPRIRRSIPEARLHIIGAHLPPLTLGIASENVIVQHQMPTRSHFRRAAIVVVPGLQGGETWLTLLKAGACGKAIIATAHGRGGLPFQPGEDLVEATSAAEVADVAVRLLRDETERARLGSRARCLAEQYDWKNIQDSFTALAEEVAGNGKPSPRASERRSFSVRKCVEDRIKGRLFLVGCPRSGTTLLQSFLAAHSAVASFPESHFFRHLVPCRQHLWEAEMAAPEARRHFQAFVRQLGRAELVRKLPRRARRMRQYVKAFVSVLDGLALEQARQYWLEKTPDHLHFINLIERYIPGARFIHVLRDGREVVASLYDVTRRYPAAWHGPWTLESCIEKWNRDVARTWEQLHKENHCLVRYEDLMEQTETVLAGLCQFLGLQLEPQMIARQRQAAKSLILPSEAWKGDVAGGLRKANDSKFETLFDDRQKAYIASRLIAADFC